jgi:hypothetical protein
LDVEVERDTNLLLSDVATDQLAVNVVGALGNFRLEEAGGVIGEKKTLVRTECDIGGRFVVGREACVEVASHQRSISQPSLDTGFVSHLLAAFESCGLVATTFELGDT